MMNGAIRTTPAIRCMIGGGMHKGSIPTIRSSCKCKNNNHNDALSSYYRYRSSTTKSKSEVSENPPTAKQLTMHALRIAVPMIGFGFMDNTIMIHAGHYVDCTLGVTFGLSTLAAAGIGQIFSGIGGVMFGETLDAAFHKISGATTMSRAQRTMKSARMVGLTGGIVGVTLGCALGLINLLFVDEHKASMLKLAALEDGQEFEFELEVDNELHPGYTTVIVRGPDVDGVLASITASLASVGCSVVELHAENRAKKKEEINGILDQIAQNNTHKSYLEDVFIIRDRATQQAIDDDDLDDLARTILSAAKDPLNSHTLKAQVDGLQDLNMALANRVAQLESVIQDRQIKVVPSSSENSTEMKQDDAT